MWRKNSKPQPLPHRLADHIRGISLLFLFFFILHSIRTTRTQSLWITYAITECEFFDRALAESTRFHWARRRCRKGNGTVNGSTVYDCRWWRCEGRTCCMCVCFPASIYLRTILFTEFILRPTYNYWMDCVSLLLRTFFSHPKGISNKNTGLGHTHTHTQSDQGDLFEFLFGYFWMCLICYNFHSTAERDGAKSWPSIEKCKNTALLWMGHRTEQWREFPGNLRRQRHTCTITRRKFSNKSIRAPVDWYTYVLSVWAKTLQTLQIGILFVARLITFSFDLSLCKGNVAALFCAMWALKWYLMQPRSCDKC